MRRVAISVAAFVLTWLAATAVAQLLFGSGNVAVWLIAAWVSAVVYLVLRRWEQRAG